MDKPGRICPKTKTCRQKLLGSANVGQADECTLHIYYLLKKDKDRDSYKKKFPL